MRIVLVGPPGAGKGTQAQFIAENFSVPHISTGDLFRYNVSNRTELGLRVKPLLDAGELVPDEITNAMAQDRISQEDARDGFLLDGFPRNVGQAQELEGWLKRDGVALDVVLELQVPHDEIVKRLSGRRLCRGCKRSWHVDFAPTAEPGVCDACGGELYQRDDDKVEAVERRLQVYAEETEPIIGFYETRDLVVKIPATGKVDEVTERALAAIKGHGQVQ